MCFGGGGGDSKIAKQQRADEVARQNRIKAGMASIAGIFDGKAAGINPATAYDPSQTYYLEDGSAYNPASGGGGFDGMLRMFAGRMAGVAPGMDPNELIRQGKLFTGVKRTGGFNDDYYAGRREAYEDYALPQLDRQYGNAKRDLIFALDRSGLLRSSAGAGKNAELSDEFDQSRLDVANKGFDVENQARANVENIRSSLVSQLNATGDDQAAAAAAIRNADTLNRPEGFSPLGQVFLNFSDTLSRIGSNARNDYSGIAGGKPLLFSSGGGSARTVG